MKNEVAPDGQRCDCGTSDQRVEHEPDRPRYGRANNRIPL